MRYLTARPELTFGLARRSRRLLSLAPTARCLGGNQIDVLCELVKGHGELGTKAAPAHMET